jgi:hypothetical protein
VGSSEGKGGLNVVGKTGLRFGGKTGLNAGGEGDTEPALDERSNVASNDDLLSKYAGDRVMLGDGVLELLLLALPDDVDP